MLLSACGQEESKIREDVSSVVLAESTKVDVTETPLPPSPTTTLASTLTPTSEPTTTATQAARVSVSENTNCRSGPGVEYLFKGVLAVGEYAEVIARSTDTAFWYITNPDIPEEGCWLWGEFAQIEGEVEAVGPDRRTVCW